MITPNGFDEIMQTFGDIRKYISIDGTLDQSVWKDEYLDIISLPFKIPLSWNKDISVSHITCHKLLKTEFSDVFNEIQIKGLSKYIMDFGGCFNFRQQRNSHSKLSTHSWGIAIDLNPNEDKQGTVGNMNIDIINIFSKHGFKWGGEFVGTKDPMHFQFATGY